MKALSSPAVMSFDAFFPIGNSTPVHIRPMVNGLRAPALTALSAGLCPGGGPKSY